MSQRNVGVVFADISGGARLARKIGTSEAQHALERCVRRMQRAIETHRGKVLTPATDEMIAAFPTADDAMQAAIEMQLRLADLPPTSGVKLSIRIGVHFGVAEDAADGPHGNAIDAGRALLKIAGQDQILTCAQTAAMLSASLRQALHSLEEITIQTADGESQLYELLWLPEPEPVAASRNEMPADLPPIPDLSAPPPAAPVATVPPVPTTLPVSERFCVRFNGKSYLVNERTPALTIGRDKTCDIVIRDRKASRAHVRVEKRGPNRFFLVDASTNGTFVVVGKERELCLHNEEMQLVGRGRLAFGHSTGNEDAEVADFEAL